MAGTVTITEETYGTIKKVKFVWTSSATGAADGTTVNSFSGKIIRFVTVPGTGGDMPTDLYDVVINDADGIDILAGKGGNRSQGATEQILEDALGCVANNKLTLAVSNAGNVKKGTVYVYLR